MFMRWLVHRTDSHVLRQATPNQSPQHRNSMARLRINSDDLTLSRNDRSFSAAVRKRRPLRWYLYPQIATNESEAGAATRRTSKDTIGNRKWRHVIHADTREYRYMIWVPVLHKFDDRCPFNKMPRKLLHINFSTIQDRSR
jgi:hypothetical protein